MRNYIILNGQNSNEITGLLIQSLPPISQPKIRTNIEEIDGRDGDIITKLGYSAYNKEISIGLYGNYDVDDIIKYFTDNQSGKVTFSDEPDKYYKYEILEQIDFDKLIRYRTAAVKLHCQPFKYSTTEEKIQINATEVSGSGSNITLENTEDGALFTSLKINGDTSQDTTTGKNLLPNDLATKTINGITITKNNDGTYKVNGTATSDVSEAICNNFISMSGTWRMLGCPSGGSSSTYMLSAYVDYWGAGSPNIDTGSGTNITYTGNVKVRFYIKSGTTCNNLIFKPMLTTDTTATDFDPYTGGIPSPNPNYPQDVNVVTGENTITIKNSDNTESQTYSIDFGNIELCKIGDYQDYIYKEDGNWYLYKEIGKYTFTGGSSEAWALNSSGKYYKYQWSTGLRDKLNTRLNLPILCNYFNQITVSQSDSKNYIGITNGSYPDYAVAIVCDITTLANFKTWLSTNQPVVYYPIATPTTTQITDEDLITQLEALIGATTYLGQTNIITSGSELNPILEVTTFAVDDPSFVITNSGNFKSKPIITIYGLGTIGLYLNGIQVLSLDMGETTSQITIDVAKLEAYNQETGALMNRSVTGDYNNLSLNVGENTITESGTLQGIEIENYSRWL